MADDPADVDDADLTPRPQTPPASPIAQVRQDILDEEWRRERLERRVNADLADHDRQLVAIHGVDGKNGKIGNLASAISTMRGAMVAIAMAVLGSLGLAVSAIYHSGQVDGARDERAKSDEERLNALDARQQALIGAFIRMPNGGAALIPNLPPAPASASGATP